MAISSTANGEQQAEGTIAQGLINMHRYKMQPPTFTGEYGTFEEWKYKFQAYMGLMDNALPQLLENTDRELHNSNQRCRSCSSSFNNR